MLYISCYDSDNDKVGVVDTSKDEYYAETMYSLAEVLALAKTKTIHGIDFRTGSVRVLSIEDIILDKVSRLRLCNCFPSYGVGIKGSSIHSTDLCKRFNGKKLVVPNEVETLGEDVFYDCGMKEVVLPKTLKRLENSVFSGCSMLEEIKIRGSRHMYMGNYIFYGCESLKHLTIADDIIVEPTGIGICSYCHSLESVELTKIFGVSVPKESFLECIRLSDLHITKAVEEIGDNAFGYCRCLSSFDFTKVKKLGDKAFIHCFNLGEALVFEEELQRVPFRCFFGCSSIRSVEFCGGCKEFEEDCFRDKNGSLESISINGVVTRFSSGCFSEQKKLKSIKFDNSMAVIIDNCAFKNCESLVDISLNKVKYLGTSAFDNTGLINLDLTLLGDSFVGSNCFSRCRQLKEVNIVSGVIGIDMFYNDSALKSVKWSSHDAFCVLKVGAFADCISLEYIELPDTLVEIEEYAFRGCTSLQEIKLPEKVNVKESVFEDCDNLHRLICDDYNLVKQLVKEYSSFKEVVYKGKRYKIDK